VPTAAAGSALLYELLLTAFLMFVIMAVATDTRAVGAAAAIAIGGTVALDALFGGPVTGALAYQLVRGRPLPDPSALPVRAPERP
jgi:glycerol uptake facilitator-like aquaporin